MKRSNMLKQTNDIRHLYESYPLVNSTGHTLADWAAFNARWQLVPIVPKNAIVVDSDKIKPESFGKVPGLPRRINGKTVWYAYKGWQRRDRGPLSADIIAAGTAVDCNIGMVTNYNPVQDIDVTNEDLSIDIQQFIWDQLGASPVRIGKWPKAAIFYALKDRSEIVASWNLSFKDEHGVIHQVQNLGEGKQAVSSGIHPGTDEPYKWLGRHPLSSPDPARVFTEISAQDLIDLKPALITFLEGRGCEILTGQTGDAVNADVVELAPSLEMVTSLMRDLPNDIDGPFDTYDAWVALGMALCGACGDANRDTVAQDLWLQWCARWPDYDAAFAWKTFDSFPLSGGLTTSGWKALVEKARDTGMIMDAYEIGGADPRATFLASPIEAEYLAPVAPPAPKGFETRSIDAAVDVQSIPAIKRLLGPHYIRGHVSTTSGAGAMGKSTLLLAEALSAALGLNKTGLAVHDGPHNVLLLSKEETDTDITKKVMSNLAVWGCAADDPDVVDALRRLRFLSRSVMLDWVIAHMGPKTGVVLNGEFFDRLEQTIVRDNIAIVIIDPLTNFVHSDLTNEMAAAIGTEFYKIADRCDVSVMIAHHTRKAAAGNGSSGMQSIDDVRGGSALTNMARSNRLVMRMSEEQAEHLAVSEDERRDLRGVVDAKANWMRPEDMRFVQLVSHELGNGDAIPVPVVWSARSDEAVVEDYLVSLLQFIRDVPDGGEPVLATTRRGQFSLEARFSLFGRLAVGRIRAIVAAALDRNLLETAPCTINRNRYEVYNLSPAGLAKVE